MLRHAISTFASSALLASVVSLGCRAAGEPAEASGQSPAKVEALPKTEAPLTLRASTVGRFGQGHSWHLNVDSASQAELRIETYPVIVKRFQITAGQMAEFRKALADERFFELGPEYGDLVVDGSVRSLDVTVGPSTHSVKVHFLMNWVHADRAKLREPSRAVRLLVMIRGWFSEPEAVDLRKYDKIVLDAAQD